MTLNPTSGPVGTTIGVWGSGFAANTSGNVTSGLGSLFLTTKADGTFFLNLTVSEGLPGGDYPIQADLPEGGPIEASATFTIP